MKFKIIQFIIIKYKYFRKIIVKTIIKFLLKFCKQRSILYLGFDIKKIKNYKFYTFLINLNYKNNLINKNDEILKKINKYKNIFNDKSCFLFANGPSLNMIDFKKIYNFQKENKYHVFCMSSYINSDYFKLVKPNQFIVSDPAFFLELEHIQHESRKNEIRKDVEKINQIKDLDLWVPIDYYEQALILYNNTNIIPFIDSENIFSNNVSNILKSRGYFSMTAYKALSIALYLGYNKIFICGFDNDFFKTLTVNKNNERFNHVIHFYENGPTETTLYKINDFSEGKTTGEYLYLQHFLFKFLEKFKDFPIINLNENSLIDIFSKKHELDVYR